MTLSIRPGRWCPPSYGLGPQAFATCPSIEADVIYVAGGLYGNPFALERLLHLFEIEPAQNKQLIFNGDLHWFDRTEEAFAWIEQRTAPFIRLRGNVETEIASQGDDAGCGCAYPDSVPDDDVERSNTILAELKKTARRVGRDAMLGALPPVIRARCDGLDVAITHGDDRSLAGWDLAVDRIDRTWAGGLDVRMQALRVGLIASSHTCLAVASTYEVGASCLAVINNGSAGLANFRGDTAGLFTRIASPRFADACAEQALYGARINGAEVAGVPLRFDANAWHAAFLNDWPEGSAAHRSYWNRMRVGPDHLPGQAARGRFRLVR